MPRRQFQVGPSAFSLVEAGGLWLVREVYWLMRRADEEDDYAQDFGPFIRPEAERQMALMTEDRGR